MDRIPDEILVQIFKYVPSNDRRNSLRLVCLRWNRITQDQLFTQEEIIIIGNYKLFLSIFQASRRSIFNLHFVQQQLDRDELSHDFWKCHGGLIRTLIFDNTQLTFSTFISIMSQCPNVNHVSLILSHFHPNARRESSSAHPENFVAKSVSSFSCCLGHIKELVAHDILRSTLSIFPNLEEFKIHLPALYLDDTGSPTPPAVFSWMCQTAQVSQMDVDLPLIQIILFLRKRGRRLKKFYLMKAEFTSDVRKVLARFQCSLPETTNLEELTFSGPQYTTSPMEFENVDMLLKSMPKLKVLNLSFVSNFEIGDILERVLDNVPSLRVLHLSFSQCPFDYNRSLVEKILLSNLQKLHLDYNGENQTQDFDQPLPVNSTLEELVLYSVTPWIEGGLFVKLSPCVPNLRYLASIGMCDRDLQSIFKNQKLLKSLVLRANDGCSDFGFTGDGPEKLLRETYSINELKDLEYLRISDMNLELTKSTTPLSFLLPKLKRLEVHILRNTEGTRPHTRFVNNLIEVITKLQHLEALELKLPVKISFKKVKSFLTSLKHIRYFSLNYNHIGTCSSSQRMIHQLFNRCPNLLVVVNQHMFYSRCEISKNEFSRSPELCYYLHESNRSRLKPNWSNTNEEEPQPYISFRYFCFDH